MNRISDSTAYGVSVRPETLSSLLSPPPLSAKARRRPFARAEGQSSACSFPMSGRLYVESLPRLVNPPARLFNQAY